jgi:serine/threonine protein kinase
MAVVYRAEDTRLGRKVALKLLTPALAENEQFQQRFIRESRLAASLDHPNIVPIYEAGESEGHLFIAMRYVPGSDLKALLSREGPLAPTRALRLFVQVGDALDAAHVLGLVHRDVKPGNILLTALTEHSGHAHPDHVYLTDFGLTKRTSSLSGSLTGTGHFLGTVDYVSPEQIQGAAVGPSTDVYALGCVLYEGLTGRLPFTRDDDAAVLWAHLVEMPPPVSAIRPELPAAVDEVVAKAMAKVPTDRYNSCRDLVRDLEDALGTSVELPAASHAGERRGARHSRSAYPLEEVPPTSDLAHRQQGAPAAPAPHDEPQVGPPDAGETLGWVSHPSLPPGPIQTPAWQQEASVGGPGPGADPASGPEGDLGPDEQEDPGEQVQGYEPEGYPAEEYADEYLPEQDPEGGPDGGEPWVHEVAAPPPPRRRRRAALVAVAAVVLVALVAAVAFLQLRREERFVRYATQDAIVAVTLTHPESWTARPGAASDVVLSPRPDGVGDVFLSDAADQWGAARQVLASSPDEARGVYIYTQASGSDTSVEGLQRTITALLGQGMVVDFGATHRRLEVGGAEAHEFEGVVSDPKAAGTRLNAMFDVVLPPGDGLVLLTFFSAPDDFEANRNVFTKIQQSVTFPG